MESDELHSSPCASHPAPGVVSSSPLSSPPVLPANLLSAQCPHAGTVAMTAAAFLLGKHRTLLCLGVCNTGWEGDPSRTPLVTCPKEHLS